ncbi:Two-component sensor protein [Bifidobacterium sp. DSM 109958]|uniref:Two-component sensor protein n=1 Tax=Bifidobacterium moraviense TaxID=2675323 RepID=A0A7Y0F4M2_9BIFI|nr:hypothetical protein [Bifidobacterium sp. DSM 109958]NMN00977.1 Two-component sensor protein [Bifidobacterium sp. DSM 109958]
MPEKRAGGRTGMATDARRRTTVEPWRSLTAFAVMLDFVLAFKVEGVGTWALAVTLVLHWCCMGVMPFAPRLGGWLTVAGFAVVAVACPAMLPMLCAGTCVALAVMAQRSGRLLELCAALIASYGGVLLGRTLADGADAGIAPADMLMIVCATASMGVSLLFRWRRESVRETENRVRREGLDRDRRIAVQMHDALTNDMSYIAAVGERHADTESGEVADDVVNDASVGGDVDAWRSVIRRAQASSRSMHGIIRALAREDDTVAGDHASSETSSTTELTTLAALQERDLADAGFSGCVSVRDDRALPDVLPPQVDDEVRSLLLELASNVRRHADRGCEYRIVVTIRPSGVEISQSDAVVVADARTVPALADDRGGLGLAWHARRVIALGGTFDHSADDGLWVLYARIPLEENTQIGQN